MRANEFLIEAAQTQNTLVLMSGGFHPFHAGHFALYMEARKTFPNATVVVGATNDMDKRPFPFDAKAKLAYLAGVEQGHFVEVQKQFNATEPSVERFVKDPETTALIYVRSEKDKGTYPMPPKVDPTTGQLPLVTKGPRKGQPVSDYLAYWPGAGQPLENMTRHGYMAYLKTVEFAGGLTSASEIRAKWPTLDDAGKIDLVNKLYPKTMGNDKLTQYAIEQLNIGMPG
jgi:hypothetical protein